MSFSVGYLRGIETFRAWVRKPRNFSKVETISTEELLPFKGIAKDVQTIGQEEMPDCKGIKYMGFKPHMIFGPKAWVEAKLPPKAKRKEDSNINSTGLVGSSADSWDRAPTEDLDDRHL